ncbi:hypothetical protein [Photorhabdus asymbiotica]|uniref:hypothetical protein n=1 Tax=Photorhabdus asymbiotica TaxID=291112 RepID=UPI003DA76BE0
MTVINLDINLRYEQREAITASIALMDLFYITQQLDVFLVRRKLGSYKDILVKKL